MLLSACAQTGMEPQPAAPVQSATTAVVAPPPQPLLPILKPGTKVRAPAKPKLDADAPDSGAAATATEAEAATGSSAEAPGTELPGSAAPGEAPPGNAGASVPEVPASPEGGATLSGSLSEPAYQPAEPEPVETGSPDDLRGQTEIQVMAALGSPATTRAEGASTIWSYKAGECALDIYFFLDVADNQRRALSYELATPQQGTPAAERCYQALKAAAASR